MVLRVGRPLRFRRSTLGSPEPRYRQVRSIFLDNAENAVIAASAGNIPAAAEQAAAPLTNHTSLTSN
jgi:hypothetical protein